MPLGKEVGLGPGHIVLDGDPALPTAAPLHFSAHAYYSYCDFVSTCTKMHIPYWFVHVQVQVLVFYAFYFLEKV